MTGCWAEMISDALKWNAKPEMWKKMEKQPFEWIEEEPEQ